MGVVSYPKDADTIGALLYAADKALYAMKRTEGQADKRRSRLLVAEISALRGLSLHDFVAIELNTYAQRTFQGTERPYMNHVTRTNPFCGGLVGDFLRHLEDELKWGTSAQWQICREEHPSLGDIERLSAMLWRCGVPDGNTEPDSQLQAFCLAALQRFQGRHDSLRVGGSYN